MRFFERTLAPLSLIAWGALAVAVGCDDGKSKEKLVEKVAGPSASNTEPPPPPKPPPDRVPDILVDNQGLYMGGERVNLQALDGPKKLQELVARFTLDGKTVAVAALRSARTPDVSAVVAALSARNVAEILLRTEDRAKKNVSIKLTPENKLGKLPDCTVVASLLKERTTASWVIRGGTANKYPRGMAGPDMSLTLEGITRQINGCASTAFLFSGDASVEWGLTFDLGNLVASAQPPLKVTTFALLKEAPVAGRAVKLTP